MDTLASYLPQQPGLLPKWLLFLSVVSIGNTIQAYISIDKTQQVYLGRGGTATTYQKTSPVTPFSARTFGTWTALASVVRLYAAYDLSNPALYQLCLWTYVIAWAHFFSEWLVFGTAKWGRGLAGPAIIATVSLAWMLAQWSAYVR